MFVTANFMASVHFALERIENKHSGNFVWLSNITHCCLKTCQLLRAISGRSILPSYNKNTSTCEGLFTRIWINT